MGGPVVLIFGWSLVSMGNCLEAKLDKRGVLDHDITPHSRMAGN